MFHNDVHPQKSSLNKELQLRCAWRTPPQATPTSQGPAPLLAKTHSVPLDHLQNASSDYLEDQNPHPWICLSRIYSYQMVLFFPWRFTPSVESATNSPNTKDIFFCGGSSILNKEVDGGERWWFTTVKSEKLPKKNQTNPSIYLIHKRIPSISTPCSRRIRKGRPIRNQAFDDYLWFGCLMVGKG